VEGERKVASHDFTYIFCVNGISHTCKLYLSARMASSECYIGCTPPTLSSPTRISRRCAPSRSGPVRPH